MSAAWISSATRGGHVELHKVTHVDTFTGQERGLHRERVGGGTEIGDGHGDRWRRRAALCHAAVAHRSPEEPLRHTAVLHVLVEQHLALRRLHPGAQTTNDSVCGQRNPPCRLAGDEPESIAHVQAQQCPGQGRARA